MLSIAAEHPQGQRGIVGEDRQLTYPKLLTAALSFDLLDEPVFVAVYPKLSGLVMGLGLASCSRPRDYLDHFAGLEHVQGGIYMRVATKRQDVRVNTLEAIGQLQAIAWTLYHKAEDRPIHGRCHRPAGSSCLPVSQTLNVQHSGSSWQ